MKKNKIIGLTVALGGMLVAFGSSIALYTKAAEDAQFSFGKYSYTASDGGITYAVTSPDTNGTITYNGSALEGRNTGTLTFNLGATYNTFLSQPSVYGNVKIEYTIPSNVNVETKAWLTGYQQWQHQEHANNPEQRGWQCYGWETWEDHPIASNNGSNITLTANSGTLVFNEDVAVPTNGQVALKVYYNITHSGSFVNVAESQIKFKVTFDAPTGGMLDYFVTGDAANWEAWDNYRMAVNLNADNQEYVFEGLTGFSQGKCRQGTGSNWSGDPNATLDPSKTYNVYWNGANGGAHTFLKVTA